MRDLGSALPMEAGHLPDVHAVDVIGGKHRHQIGRVALDEVEIPMDGIRRSLEGHDGAAGFGEHHANGGIPTRGPGGPRRVDVLDQGSRLVLRQHVDRADPGVDQVAEDEIDDPVAGGEHQRGLRVPAVNGCSRVPLPPAMTMARIFMEQAPPFLTDCGGGVPEIQPSGTRSGTLGCPSESSTDACRQFATVTGAVVPDVSPLCGSVC